MKTKSAWVYDQMEGGDGPPREVVYEVDNEGNAILNEHGNFKEVSPEILKLSTDEPWNKPPETAFCLVCEKAIEIDLIGSEHYYLVGAGKCIIHFGYGSKLDQCPGAPKGLFYEPDDILAADEILTFICDDCFEKKKKFMKGYEFRNSTNPNHHGKWDRLQISGDK